MRITATMLVGLVAGFIDSGSAAVLRTDAATITVSSSTTGTTLPRGLAGFSLETSTLTKDEFAHTNLPDLLRTLGPTGELRIGGNSVEWTFWTSTNEKPPANTALLTPSALQTLAASIVSTGWRVILAVNFKDRQPARAADEARYAARILGRQLAAIEIGNESNYYYPSKFPHGTLFTDLDAYAAAIERAVPGIALSGPDAGLGQPQFVADIAAHETTERTAGRPALAVLTDHNYPLVACRGHQTTIAELLSQASHDQESDAAMSAAAAASEDRVPAMMSETNSVACGGQAGVSNVYAAALWTLDYLMLLAERGIVGADFHGAISGGCLSYGPLCTPAGSTHLQAQPVFYGMLAAAQVDPGSFHFLTNSDPADIRAYAIGNAHHLSLVLDDVQDPTVHGAMTVTVRLPGVYRVAAKTVLTDSSPKDLAATSGVTLGGEAVGPQGAFGPLTYNSVPVHGSTVAVTVSPGSAVIIKLS